jgi:archaemetzincin
MNLPKVLIFLMAVMFVSCSQNKPVEIIKKPLSEINTKTNELIISIQPFNDLPEEYLEYVIQELRKVYPRVSIQPPIELPQTALNQSGTRYRADSLIRFLRDRRYYIKSTQIVIGLTSKDISVTKGQTSDCCLMGLSYRPGKACVASSYRLKKHNKPQNLFKLAIHELGHTQGLHHCLYSTCLMKATKNDHFNKMTNFCPKCKETLNKAGWTLK